MNTTLCPPEAIPDIPKGTLTPTPPVAPTVGNNAFEQVLHELGIKPFDTAWVRQFKKDQRLTACPSFLTRSLSRLCENPTGVLPLAITLLAVGALLNGLNIPARNSITLGLSGLWFSSYVLGFFASEFLDFPVWRKTQLRSYREPIPKVTHEFIGAVDTEVKGVTWKVEKLTMTSDPLLIAEYGNKTYYLKRWEETPPQND